MYPLNDSGYPTAAIPFDHDDDPTTAGFVVNVATFVAVGDRYPAGEYTLRFAGHGKVSLGWDAGLYPDLGYDAQPRQFESAGGAVSFDVLVTPNIGIHVQIDESDASNPVRDIELLLPGFADSATTNPQHPFYPPFIVGLQGFSAIRVMNPLQINDLLCDDPAHVPSDRAAYVHCAQAWENRVPVNYYSYYSQAIPGRGTAWEYLISMVNAVPGADIWINVPHGATPDYVQNLASLLRIQLQEDRKVYIEWSNEIYNFSESFPQHMWFEDNGELAFPDEPQPVAAACASGRGKPRPRSL